MSVAWLCSDCYVALGLVEELTVGGVGIHPCDVCKKPGDLSKQHPVLEEWMERAPTKPPKKLSAS